MDPFLATGANNIAEKKTSSRLQVVGGLAMN